MSFYDLQKGVRYYLHSNDGDQFKACNAMCNEAEKLHKKYPVFDGKECLVYALTGKLPVSLHDKGRQYMNLTVPKTSYMKNLLEYIDNEERLEILPEIRENVTDYPESNALGDMPSYGFYIRHAENVKLENVTIKPRSMNNRPMLGTLDADVTVTD